MSNRSDKAFAQSNSISVLYSHGATNFFLSSCHTTMSDFNPFNMDKETEEMAQKFWDDPDFMVNTMEEYMGEIEMIMQRKLNRLKSLEEAKECDVDGKEEVAEGSAAANADGDEKVKIPMLERELEKLADALKDQQEQQDVLLNQLDELRNSKAISNECQLAELKVQLEGLCENGKKLVQDVLRLEIKFDQLEIDDIDKARTQLLEIRTKRLEHQTNNLPPRTVNLFTSENFLRVMELHQSTFASQKMKSKLRGISSEIRAYNKENSDALKLIEKLQNEKLDRVQGDSSGVEKVIQNFQEDLSLADTAAARDDFAARPQVEQSEPGSIRCLRHEVKNASNAHKDLLCKQSALMAELNGMAKEKSDEGFIGKLDGMKSQFQEFASMRTRMLENLRDLDDKIARLRQRKRNTLNQQAVEELLDMANDESEILDEIEKNNLIVLSEIETLEQVATATMGDPRLRTM